MKTGNHITMTYAEYMAGGLGKAMMNMKWEIDQTTTITITDCPEHAIREMEEAGIGVKIQRSYER